MQVLWYFIELCPRIKYYATKTICFCEVVVKHGIKLFKIDTVDHLGNLFMKGLPITMF